MAVIEALESTADPFWQSLVGYLVQPQAHSADSTRLFTVFDHWDCIVFTPAFVFSALIKTLGSSAAPLELRVACAGAAARIVDAHANVPALLTSPHQVWGEARSTPKTASLKDAFAEGRLKATLLECLRDCNSSLAREAAKLLSALVRVGCPKKLVAGTEAAEGAADLCTAATAFRKSIVQDREWRGAVYEQDLPAAHSDTLVGWVVFSLAYLLACPSSRRLLLQDVATRDKLISRLVDAARSTSNKAQAKYGTAALAIMLREELKLSSAMRRQVAAALTARVRDLHLFSGKELVLDHPKILALEGLVLLGKAERACLAGLTAEDAHALQHLVSIDDQAKAEKGSITQQAAEYAAAILSYATGDAVNS